MIRIFIAGFHSKDVYKMLDWRKLSVRAAFNWHVSQGYAKACIAWLRFSHVTTRTLES